MNARHRREEEIREVLIAANSGELTSQQIERMDSLIQGDPKLARYAARFIDQQASLTWQADVCDALPTGKVPKNVTVERQPQSSLLHRSRAHGHSGWPTIAAGIAFVLGAAAAMLLQSAIAPPTPPAVRINSPTLLATPAYEARLVRSTACLWDGRSNNFHEIGSGLSSGDSLHLLEGLAEFNLNWSVGGDATLSLEGPAAMMLNTEGMPTLRFGKLTSTITAGHRPFVLDTPVGRLVLTEFGSIGVSAFGNEAEIHVFDGAATLEMAWLSSGESANAEPLSSSRQVEAIRIEAGEAIRVRTDDTGELLFEWRSADEAYFVAQVSMASDSLPISPAYVEAVKADAPVAYWRFERDAWPLLPNEMGPRFECHVNGSLGRVRYAGNQAIEFGLTDLGGEILSNETFDEIIHDNYSIEMWLKPSHYHVGAVISFVGDPETANQAIPHGMLLELGGHNRMPSAEHHPGRIRFLHRNPASNKIELGTSCYSSTAYALREWQHVVAVKNESTMQLYVDGELVGEGQDHTELPSNLRLLVGWLYPARRVRPYIGQLDELALYDHALSQQEIRAHYRLIHSTPTPEPGI